MNQNRYPYVISRAVFLALLCFLIAIPVYSQNKTKIIVPLQINRQYKQPMGFFIQFDAPKPLSQNGETGSIRYGKTPTNTLIALETIQNKDKIHRIKIDSNGDGNLTNEQAHLIQPDSPIDITVEIDKGNARKETMPFQITYERDADKNTERFSWNPLYRSEGKLMVKGCESLFIVLDLNADGVFNQADLARGSAIGIDRNGDGKIFGKGEWLYGTEIIEFCGQFFLIDSIEPDGTSISLTETNLRVPKIGEPFPAFSLTTTTGKSFNTAEVKGKVYLFDFWASWCQPCVEKFVHIREFKKKFGDKIEIILINTDKKSRIAQAKQIIKKHELNGFVQIMNGLGMEDPLWQTFGDINNNSKNFPLYVVSDRKGQISYAAAGGDNLSELSTEIEKLLQIK
jgi:thiol-disulfide isomerase/thioredoxin